MPILQFSSTLSQTFLSAKAISKLSIVVSKSNIKSSFANNKRRARDCSSFFLLFIKSAFVLCQPSRYSCFSSTHFLSFSLCFLFFFHKLDYFQKIKGNTNLFFISCSTAKLSSLF